LRTPFSNHMHGRGTWIIRFTPMSLYRFKNLLIIKFKHLVTWLL